MRKLHTSRPSGVDDEDPNPSPSAAATTLQEAPESLDESDESLMDAILDDLKSVESPAQRPRPR